MIRMEISTDSNLSMEQVMELVQEYAREYRALSAGCLVISGVECLANPYLLILYDQLSAAGLNVYVENGGMLLDPEMIELFRDHMEGSEGQLRKVC